MLWDISVLDRPRRRQTVGAGHAQLTPVCRCCSPSSPAPSLGRDSDDSPPPRPLSGSLVAEEMGDGGKSPEMPRYRLARRTASPGGAAERTCGRRLHRIPASPHPGPLRSRRCQGAPRGAGVGSGAVLGRAAANGAAGAVRAVQEHPGGDSDAPPSRRRAGAGEHGRGAALSPRRRPGKGGRPSAPRVRRRERSAGAAAGLCVMVGAWRGSRRPRRC